MGTALFPSQHWDEAWDSWAVGTCSLEICKAGINILTSTSAQQIEVMETFQSECLGQAWDHSVLQHTLPPGSLADYTLQNSSPSCPGLPGMHHIPVQQSPRHYAPNPMN